ncbi:hypothetical protein KR009_011711 [Drosophila setifemur]|nr:hypothetical protein KR009_011711 [Drosophila setifemur]
MDSTTLADDSGHFSDDWSSTGVDLCPKSQTKSVILVPKEMLRSSEVERLLKSEHWYKRELKSHKLNLLETLERLYAQERKYLLENQQLQQESRRLNVKCAKLEKQQKQKGPRLPQSKYSIGWNSNDASFEGKQQEARLQDQLQLIDVLRKQKKFLLEDIQRLSFAHEDKLIQKQQLLAGVELESKHETSKCKQLLDEKSQMEHQLQLKNIALRGVATEREQLRQVIIELNKTLLTQEQLLAIKEQEFLDLKQYYQQKLTRESSVDMMHSYSMRFHEEINSKTSEIASLKNTLNELQSELIMMSQLKEHNEKQQRQLDQLEFKLNAQFLEQDQLRQSDALKMELEILRISFASLKFEKETLKEKEQQVQVKLIKLDQEVQKLHSQYAEMCSMCDEIKLQLEKSQFKQEEHKRQNFLKESELVKQLKVYADKCDALFKTESQINDKSKQPKICEDQLNRIRDLKPQDLKQCQNNAIQHEAGYPVLIQRIEFLEKQFTHLKAQKMQTICLLQMLIQQQDAKIKCTNEMKADWLQLLNTLHVTQQLKHEMRDKLQQKTVKLERLNKLFAGQNEELQMIQQLGLAKEEENRLELQMLKKTFHDNVKIHSPDSLDMKRLQVQINSLLDKREENVRQEQKAVDFLRHIKMKNERQFQHIKCWLHLAKLLRKKLRSGSAQKAEEAPGLKINLGKVSAMHDHALHKNKFLEKPLAAERQDYAVLDTGKSTTNTTPQKPAHEAANLIDDYKKLVQQTAWCSGRPHNSYILELIERSQRIKPNLCQLSEGVDACRLDIERLSKLLNGDRDQRRARVAPSLMAKLLEVN